MLLKAVYIVLFYDNIIVKYDVQIIYNAQKKMLKFCIIFDHTECAN